MSSVGRDPANALVLPVEVAPLRAGTIEWSGGKIASFRVEPGVAALVNGKAVSEIQILQPVIVAIGDLRLRFGFSSESQLRIGVLDLNARMRKAATPSVWFPIDARYRIAADWIPFPEPKMVRIADNDGGSREWKNPGYGSFMIDGKTVTLQGVLSPDGKQMAFFFRDQTAETETYGAGRFVDVDPPKNGKVIIDFNKAYNPSCAFNTLFVCPIPPRENHLPIRIAAGERNYPHQGEVH
jgi:uncharacterized protein (DUF1684 family)